MTIISPDEISFHPLSFADLNARLFTWKGELFRGVTTNRATVYREMFQNGVAQDLIGKKLLIETELTAFQVPKYDLVLKHRKLPFVSYAFEWSAEMLRDSALMMIELQLELSRNGLTLHDAHPWNILFDGTRPLFVDFGSIRRWEGPTHWGAYDEFCRYLFYPLHLFASGHGRIARALLFEWDKGVLAAEFEALRKQPPKIEEPVVVPEKNVFRSLLGFGKKTDRVEPAKRLPPPIPPPTVAPLPLSPIPQPYDFATKELFLERLKQAIQAVELPWVKTDWSGYYDAAFPPLTPHESWHLKHRNVHDLLSELRPATVLDVGSNRGWYAQLAASLGSTVVGLDIDETCVSRLYADAKTSQANILPLVMSFLKPSPGYGLNQWFAPASERLSCDLVLGLAIVHHLVFKSRLFFDQIVAGLSIFSKRWLLVEFIPREDKYVAEWYDDSFAWYTLDNFQAELRKVYCSIRIVPSFHEPRLLLLCERA
jgi:SAM-dependent methyltransferase